MLLRLVFALPAIALVAAIAWAWNKADLWTAILQVGQNPWGVVTFIDLYAGFIITGVIIAAIERWKPWTFVMLALSFGLGNIVYGAWGAWRGAEILRGLARR
jgi:hypothetical protein